MSTEVATVQAARHGTLAQRMDYARALAASNLLPSVYRGKPENVLVAIEYGHALGMAAIEAINSIFVVEGKPTMSADLMAARVRMAGHKLRVIENQDGSVEAHLIRSDDPDFVFRARWDEAKAKAADLAGKGNWKKYASQMMRARAVSEVCRMGANDALHGVIYVPEELGADVTESGEPVARTEASGEVVTVDAETGEVIEPQRDEQPWEQRIDACGTDLAALGDLWRAARGLPDVQALIAATAQQIKNEQAADEQAEPGQDDTVDAEVVDAEVVEAEPADQLTMTDEAVAS